MKQEGESQLDEQVEWFHSFAEQPVAAIAAQASDTNRAWVARFVADCLPHHSFPPNLDPEQFAKEVKELRGNERGWNRGLMAALVQADDLVSSQGAQAAAASLESFANSCPWALFAEVARNQAARYIVSGE